MKYLNYTLAVLFTGIAVSLVYLLIALIMEYLFLANMNIFHEVCIPIAFFFWGFFARKVYVEYLEN